MARDMPEPCKCPSFDSCQKRFLWPHKEVDLAIHAVVSLVVQVGEAEKSPPALDFEGPDPGSRRGRSVTQVCGGSTGERSPADSGSRSGSRCGKAGEDGFSGCPHVPPLLRLHSPTPRVSAAPCGVEPAICSIAPIFRLPS